MVPSGFLSYRCPLPNEPSLKNHALSGALHFHVSPITFSYCRGCSSSSPAPAQEAAPGSEVTMCPPESPTSCSQHTGQECHYCAVVFVVVCDQVYLCLQLLKAAFVPRHLAGLGHTEKNKNGSLLSASSSLRLQVLSLKPCLGSYWGIPSSAHT